MTYLKIGGLALAALALWMFFSWASNQIRRGYEADQLQSQLDAKAEQDASDAKAYQAGLNDGAASVKVTETIKKIYIKVPAHVQKADACAVDPDAVRLRNAARRDGYRQAVPAAGAPDADAGGAGATPGEPIPR